MPLHFRWNSFLSKIIPAWLFIPCRGVHACPGLFSLPALRHSLSESGIAGVMLCSSETSRAGSILQDCLWCSKHGFLCNFFKSTFSRPRPCAHQLEDTSLSFPATSNSSKVNEGFRLLPPNADCFPCVTFLAFNVYQMFLIIFLLDKAL